MTETEEKVKNVRENLVVKLIIVILVFPTLVVAFHMLLMVPAILIGSLLMHFGGHPEFWGKALSVIALLPACWGAFAVCKLVWRASK